MYPNAVEIMERHELNTDENNDTKITTANFMIITWRVSSMGYRMYVHNCVSPVLYYVGIIVTKGR